MKLPSIRLTQEALSSFDEALQKEWLVTNGLGGYASSTALGVNTRKYHGLLVAALNPPANRTVCLTKLDEEAWVSNSVYRFGANEFRDAVYPQGHQLLKEFTASPFPRYIYHAPSVEVSKTIFMPTGKNATAAVYTVLNGSGSDVKFRIYPLLTCRHFHLVVNRARSHLSFSQQQSDREVALTFASPQATVVARATAGIFVNEPNWIERLYYREEDKRGESSIDDCYQPGYFEVSVSPKRQIDFAVVTAASENERDAAETLDSIGNTTRESESLLEQKLARRSDSLVRFYAAHTAAPVSDWLNWILLAADAFIVHGAGDSASVIAGYHWFETWGRDTFISLPGLMLATGKFTAAEKILAAFQRHCKQGLMPNCVEDQGSELSYNTVDATLWYVNAVLQYLKYTGNFLFVKQQLWATLKTIVENHSEGAAFSIRLDNDGLLAHGPRLTWMDAAVDGAAVTPRAGKAVEIQALWYNTLRTMHLLAGRFGENRLAEKYAEMATAAQASFNLKFWNSEKNCLFDVITDVGVDAALRPNQIIAATLDYSMLDAAEREQVVDVVQRELLTSCGLRTLARDDPRYRGVYAGERRSRDYAYHNGTVWPWLLGPFTTAFLKAKGHGGHWLEYAEKHLIAPLFTKQILQAGLGTVSEIFDGDQPHLPRGCIAQAWSVAEPLRAYVEDVLQIRPKYEKDVLQA